MTGLRPARVLAAEDVRRVLVHVGGGDACLRNTVIIMLSVYAGLRACEIAGLSWAIVLNADGSIDRQLRIADAIAKNGSGRTIPMHPSLAVAMKRWHRRCNRTRCGPVVTSTRTGGAMTAKTIVNWFRATYRDVGLDGCSSHSGRRTFIMIFPWFGGHLG